ncbi:MAG: hypothetical protein M1305_01735 [Candidatus Marsarchaeota archaeon]|nr:hypothetical protein [Candidatus Marsarchaeota archaeon]
MDDFVEFFVKPGGSTRIKEALEILSEPDIDDIALEEALEPADPSQKESWSRIFDAFGDTLCRVEGEVVESEGVTVIEYAIEGTDDVEELLYLFMTVFYNAGAEDIYAHYKSLSDEQPGYQVARIENGNLVLVRVEDDG